MRVAVFIDWMNVYNAARYAFGLTDQPSNRGQVDPYRLGRALSRRGMKGSSGELVRVEVHRGQPLPNQNRIGHMATGLQGRRWELSGSDVVKARLRPLRANLRTKRLEEKGVDVALAVSAIEWAILGNVDRVVVFSHDTDLSPAVETIARIRGPQAVETASWRSGGYRKRIPPIEGVKNHFLHERIFLELEDRTHYGRAARKRIEERTAARSRL